MEKVAIITGFFEEYSFLKILFYYLDKQTYKNFDVYVYNYKFNDIPEIDKEKYSFDYQIFKLDENVGFAGGNNHAINKAKKKDNYAYYALINDDTKPDVKWLENLVVTAASNKTVGAVTSKMLFYEKFVSLKGHIYNDGTRLNDKAGVKFYLNSKFEDCFYKRKFFITGFNFQEEDEFFDYRWTKEEFEVRLPVISDIEKEMVKLNLFIRKNPLIKNQSLSLTIGNYSHVAIDLEEDTIFYPIEIPVSQIKLNWYNIIQNAGSNFDKKYNGYDIGSGQIDIGQYDKEKEAILFCGGACLLTEKALQSTGLFNGSYFSYYEDSDLSVRLRKKGFRIIYNPYSFLYHHHSATSKEWSAFFTYHVFRNKIIFATVNFGIKGFWYCFGERTKETFIFFRRASKNKFKDKSTNHRLKLNLTILKDALTGIIKYKPSKY